MSGDQLDLDEAREKIGDALTPLSEVQALADELVAEVRRLRALPDLTLGWSSTQGVLVITDPRTAARMTLREWIDNP